MTRRCRQLLAVLSATLLAGCSNGSLDIRLIFSDDMGRTQAQRVEIDVLRDAGPESCTTVRERSRPELADAVVSSANISLDRAHSVRLLNVPFGRLRFVGRAYDAGTTPIRLACSDAELAAGRDTQVVLHFVCADEGGCCVPVCDGKPCGADDGCGGICQGPDCRPWLVCDGDDCRCPDGTPSCGMACCAADEVCRGGSEAPYCCRPSCAPGRCGQDNGCGETCGCDDGLVCNEGQCASPTLMRVSVGPNGEEADGDSHWATISEDGRIVAFSSDATNLVAGDENGVRDRFVRHLESGTTRALSRVARYTGSGPSDRPTIAAQGRYVVFVSDASRIVHPWSGTLDAPLRQVVLYDLLLGTRERISNSAATGYAAGNADSDLPVISAWGEAIAFASSASDLVVGDNNQQTDVFHYDVRQRTMTLVSTQGTTQGNLASSEPSITGDGRFVAFSSLANNWGETHSGKAQIYLHDKETTGLTLVSRNPSSTPPSGNEASLLPRVLLTARPSPGPSGQTVTRVIWHAAATNLDPRATDGQWQLFLYLPLSYGPHPDPPPPEVYLASTTEAGVIGNDASYDVDLAHDPARHTLYAVFTSWATNLVPEDTRGIPQVFVKNIASGAVALVSKGPSGEAGDGPSGLARLSATGEFIVFLSLAENLVADDRNGKQDVFMTRNPLFPR